MSSYQFSTSYFRVFVARARNTPHSLCVVAAVAWFVVAMPTGAHALLSFGAAEPVAEIFRTDDALEQGPCIATDGAGTVVVGWASTNDLGGTIGDDRDLLFVRSTDGGVSWSSAAPADPAHAAADTEDAGTGCRVATDQAGTWIMMHSDNVFRSTDNGATWTFTGASVVGGLRYIPGDAFITLWQSNTESTGTTGDDYDLFLRRSTDGGLTWSAAIPVNSNATTDSDPFDIDQKESYVVASDGSVNVVWESNDVGVYRGTYFTRSTDGGVSWTPRMLISTPTLSSQQEARIAVTDAGTLVVAVSQSTTAYGGFVAEIARSTDSGASWTLVPVNPGMDGNVLLMFADGEHVAMINGSDSDFGAIGTDQDIIMYRSEDAGLTWSDVTAVTSSAAWDGVDDSFDSSPRSVRVDSERRILIWQSNATLRRDVGNAQSLGDDQDILITVARETCPAVPAAGCTSSIVAGKGALKIKNKLELRDSLKWKAAKLDETLDAELGDPATTSDYALCIYEGDAGLHRLVLERTLDAGAVCRDGEPCWKVKPSTIRFKDGIQRNGAVKKLSLRAGPAGKAKLTAVASGPTLNGPLLPIATVPDVRAQLINLETGACWESSFTVFSTNTVDKAKAKSD